MGPGPVPATLGDWLDLREGMRAAELLLEDVQIAPAGITTYWAISAELLALLEEVDDYLERRRDGDPAPDDAEHYLSLRRRYTAVLAKATEIGIAPEEE
jgi:hypothetical protein